MDAHVPKAPGNPGRYDRPVWGAMTADCDAAVKAWLDDPGRRAGDTFDAGAIVYRITAVEPGFGQARETGLPEVS